MSRLSLAPRPRVLALGLSSLVIATSGLVVATSGLIAGCGGAPAPASSTPASEGSVEAPAAPKTSAGGTADSSEAGEEESAPPGTLPTQCSKKSGEMCTPPVAFVKRLCGGFHPDVALVLFSKGSPWTRVYLAANVKAWNASGGASSEDELKFDEEVIVLHHRQAAADGIQVSGATDGYDVLRWDGTCATLDGGEITTKPPPKAKNAPIAWKDLHDDVRNALLSNTEIDETNRDRKKECKGASMGTVSKKCITLVNKQSDLIVKFVRDGGAVPPPPNLP